MQICFVLPLLLLFFASATCGQDLRLVGSTPCDSAVRAGLLIPAGASCDFIRWQLELGQGEKGAGPFRLEVRIGAAQPNTTGFVGGGQVLSFRGRYTLAAGKEGGNVYRLRSNGPAPPLRLAQLDGNLYHLLDSGGRPLVGNGGWSYTLVREEGPAVNSAPLPVFPAVADTAREAVYDGRTPCAEITRLLGLEVRSGCFKLKWRLRLRRDGPGGQPATFSLSWTLERPNDITGTWRVIRGIPGRPEAVIYRLDFADHRPSLAFWAAGGNLLFFLDKEGQLLKGNKDFTYTLNRRP